MMRLSFNEKLGLLKSTIEFMEQNSDALMKAGFNTELRIGDQKEKYEHASALNEKQESLKAQLNEHTKSFNDAVRDAYVTASGNIDAMEGVLGKNSEKAKDLRRLRSKIRQKSRRKSPISL